MLGGGSDGSGPCESCESCQQFEEESATVERELNRANRRWAPAVDYLRPEDEL